MIHDCDVEVPVISENGLEKQIFCFRYSFGSLTYFRHYEVHRSTRRERWADEINIDILSYDWCKARGLGDCRERYLLDQDRDDYTEYLRSVNPVLQKTRSGKPKLSGIIADIKHMPLCPPSVAKQALKLFRKREINLVYR